ncbi:paraquat-inducible membrane protein A [Psychromonas sp. RZ22]|uniref:paraquat-inducible protein A n=1 Tax=Psychromonas algarum TaxID=2555643 RepID=UPI001067887B|nr:paraquat-inducible protein A [Psychromonas sp. RZ22]TEW56144.1 paraquat-inducible membrane protein A [Psychromonas sp. RZ22]
MDKPLKPGISAIQQNRQLCRICDTDCSITGNATYCPHCGSPISPRIKNSQQKTWALLFTAIVFIFPANLYPITYLLKNNTLYPDTIFSGILSLLDSDMPAIAFIVFIASILVPILKILALTFISFAVHFQWQLNPKKQLIAFSIVEWIGRWSILDLFVISIMVAVFDKGNLLSVYPGIAATSFTVVVVTTLFAAESFDTRLIWDANIDAK